MVVLLMLRDLVWERGLQLNQVLKYMIRRKAE